MALPSTTNKSKNNHYLLTDTEFANTPISDFSEGDEIDVYQAGGIPKSDLSSEVQNTLNAVAGKSTVSVSATGTATDEVGYITIDGQEKKIAGGGGSALYRHAIEIVNWNSGGKLHCYFDYIDDVATPYSDYDSLRTAIPDNTYMVAGGKSIVDFGDGYIHPCNVVAVFKGSGGYDLRYTLISHIKTSTSGVEAEEGEYYGTVDSTKIRYFYDRVQEL